MVKSLCEYKRGKRLAKIKAAKAKYLLCTLA